MKMFYDNMVKEFLEFKTKISSLGILQIKQTLDGDAFIDGMNG